MSLGCSTVSPSLINRDYIDEEVFKTNYLEFWHRLSKFRKPTIAAVSGYAVRLNYRTFLFVI